MNRLNHPSLALACRLAAAGLSFLLGIAVARLLGVEQFGYFSVLLAFLNVGVVVALLGHESLATREIAAALKGIAHRTTSVMTNYRAGAARQVWMMGAVVVAAEILLFQFLPAGHNAAPAWLAMLLLVPLIARTRLSQAMLRGAHLASLAIVPDGIIRPMLALAGVSAIVWAGCREPVAPLVGVLVAGACVALVAALILERDRLGRNVPSPAALGGPQKDAIRFSVAMFTSSLFAVLGSQLALIAVGNLADAGQAGLYAAAERFALAAALAGEAVYLAVASRIATLHADGGRQELQALIRRTTRTVGAATVILCLLIYGGAEILLGLYGHDFAKAKDVLTVFLIATSLNVLAGPTGQLLLMTHHEKLHFMALASSVSVQATLLLLLVPRYGAYGAAISVLAATMVWNLGMMLFIRNRLRLNPLLAWA